MNHPYDAVKLVLDERHRELITQNYVVNQLKGNENSPVKSWSTGLSLGFLDKLRIPSVFNRLYQVPVTTTQSGNELLECQATPECQCC